MFNLEEHIKSYNIQNLITVYKEKITLEKLCQLFNVDVINNYFFQLVRENNIFIDELLLDYIEISGETYEEKKKNFFNFLKEKNITLYNNNKSDNEDNFFIKGDDFEKFIMQINTSRGFELRSLFIIMKNIIIKYCEYEKEYEKKKSMDNDNLILTSLNELKEMFHIFQAQLKDKEEMKHINNNHDDHDDDDSSDYLKFIEENHRNFLQSIDEIKKEINDESTIIENNINEQKEHIQKNETQYNMDVLNSYILSKSKHITLPVTKKQHVYVIGKYYIYITLNSIIIYLFKKNIFRFI
ncbi:MSV199 domain protein [Leptopilina boulardi filamentous virus]|uniref:MSV199 domain protein n=1 Tax=Leptopilina boulardi filamentous virus TaxID=552509 RepID=A0A1S5YD21_9VIRU|nr:MSV199 domain protein [Leptopilina boulardi filamentous virus]AQQ80021.1 MSV199 domain protein [Leptopilina boulardi filamentous virus]